MARKRSKAALRRLPGCSVLAVRLCAPRGPFALEQTSCQVFFFPADLVFSEISLYYPNGTRHFSDPVLPLVFCVEDRRDAQQAFA